MTDFHKCIQTNSFSDIMYSMSHLWHQMSSPISCPHQPSLSLRRSPHLTVYPISVPIPILLLHHSPCNAAMIVCSSFPLTHSFLPPSIFHPCQLPSFNLCLRLQLGEHITSLTGSIGETRAGFILSFSLTMSSLLIHPALHHASSILPISFLYAPVLFRLTYFSPDISSSLIFCHRCDFAFLSFSSLHRRVSPAHHYCSEHPAHCPSLSHPPPRIKEWNGRFLPSFHHFSHLRLSFWSSVVVMLPPTPSDSSSPQAPFSILIRRREGNFCDSPHLVMFQAILRGWR